MTGRLQNASITVTRSQGSRTADGWQQSSTTTVLACRGDFQQEGKVFRERQAHYEAGDGLFFAANGVADVEPSDEVAISHDDGRTLTGTVEEVMTDDDSLLIALD